ncbi:MAG: hydroxyacylglutathione hydrolase [Bosea sp.]|nr:hydroxyacylglutathione hydrolase [Bosea sp. (in: a-proteobacteria)]
MPIDLHAFRCLGDNCGALIRDRASGLCAAVDAPDAGAVNAAAIAMGWNVSHLFITHEHADHVQGADALARLTGCEVIGPREAARAVQLDRIVGEGDEVSLGDSAFSIWATPGHCAGHLGWVCAEGEIALVGDVVFVMGCGRLSGDTAPQLWRAISRIAALPDSVRLVTGHDYTRSNASFARAVEPGDAAIAARAAEAERRAAAQDFWAVTTVGEEKATNPFFRAGEAKLMARLGAADAAASFAKLRQMKNEFRA